MRARIKCQMPVIYRFSMSNQALELNAAQQARSLIDLHSELVYTHSVCGPKKAAETLLIPIERANSHIGDAFS